MKIFGLGMPYHLCSSLRSYGADVTTFAVQDPHKVCLCSGFASCDVLVGNLDVCDWLEEEMSSLRKQHARLPVIGLVHTNGIPEWQRRVEFLDAGGDVLLLDPVRPEELLAHARSLVRQAVRLETNRFRRVEIGSYVLQVDYLRKLVTVNEQPLVLTAFEWLVVSKLAEEPGKVCSRELLFDHLGSRHDHNTIDVFVSRMRKKFERAATGSRTLVKNVRGVGYRLNHN